jgi:pimeloyl-ACP methyl ester carboxylesterase
MHPPITHTTDSVGDIGENTSGLLRAMRDPIVLLHGFMDSPRTWDLVAPALQRDYEVLAPALPGHAGGPPLDVRISDELMPDAVEEAMDAARIETAHLAGNSLGGWVALQLAARGRARSVVALAPAGGWADSPRELLELQRALHAEVRAMAPNADAIAATPEGRQRATALIAEHGEDLPADLVAELIVAVARSDADRLIDYALESDWTLDAERIECPVRIVWGTADQLLPWPAAAARFRDDWLPNADWVELEGVGHAPQLDAPLETAQLIAGFP